MLFIGKNASVEKLWEAAKEQGSDILLRLNQIFKIPEALQKIGTDNTDVCKIQMDTLVKRIKTHININFGLENEVFKALKKQCLSRQVKYYEGENEYNDIRLSSEQKRNVVALQTLSDGRCFYHAVALNIGKDSSESARLPDLLKLLLALDILTNRNFYKPIFQSKANVLSESIIHAKQSKTALKILASNRWADSWIIKCMSAFLNRKIISYQTLDNSDQPILYDFEFGQSNSEKCPILVAYVSTAGSATPNHYVALLKRNESSEAPQVTLNSSNDPPVEVDLASD